MIMKFNNQHAKTLKWNPGEAPKMTAIEAKINYKYLFSVFWFGLHAKSRIESVCRRLKVILSEDKKDKFYKLKL